MTCVNVVATAVPATVAAAERTKVVAFVIETTVVPTGMLALPDRTAPTLIPAVEVVVAVVERVVVTARLKVSS